jgi:uncharacterized protein DUF1918
MSFHSRSTLRAAPGDRLLVKGHAVGDVAKDGEIIEVLGESGAPPYVVRWEDGHESRVYPGSDMSVHHFEHEDG